MLSRLDTALANYLDALRAETPVFRDQPAWKAVQDAKLLGGALPGARIVDRDVDTRTWRALRQGADAEAVAFSSRHLERAWQNSVLGYSDAAGVGP